MSRTPLEPRDLRRTSEPIRGERTERTTRPGAVAPEPRSRRRRLGWLWALLGLLAVALLAALVLGLFDGDDDGGQTAGQGQSAAEQQGAGSADEGAGAGGGATATDGGGSLTVGGTSILPPPAGGLGDYVGQDAAGTSAVVQSVVRNAQDDDTLEGFWVGRSEQDRVYVEWGGTVGSDEADYTPEVGEKVDLTGPVRPAPEKPETALKLNPADAELVRTHGGFVNADEVSPAQD